MTAIHNPEQISVAIRRAASVVGEIIASGPCMGMNTKDALHFTMAAALLETLPESELMTVWADAEQCSFSLGHLVRVGSDFYYNEGLAPDTIAEDWLSVWRQSIRSPGNYQVTIQEDPTGLSECYGRASWRRLFLTATEELSLQLSISAQESALEANTSLGATHSKSRL
jgi:hypothetical protein